MNFKVSSVTKMKISSKTRNSQNRITIREKEEKRKEKKNCSRFFVARTWQQFARKKNPEKKSAQNPKNFLRGKFCAVKGKGKPKHPTFSKKKKNSAVFFFARTWQRFQPFFQ